MKTVSFLAVSFLTACVLATLVNATPSPLASSMKAFKNPTVRSSVGGHATCIEGIIDVTASANNIRVELDEPKTQIELTELVLELAQANSTLGKRILGGSQHISGTYGIYSQLCVPTTTAAQTNSSTMQFLIHGGGFDRLYWDNAPGYSYVDYAAEKGYPTFSYDRLGTGLSDHPDPIQVVQTTLHVAIAHELVQLLRNGHIASTDYKTVVGVGHSYGSAQTLGITSAYPKDFDAVILTGAAAEPSGYLLNIVSQLQTIAALNDPSRFSQLSYGYALPGAMEGLQFGFFRAPNFDPQLLDLAESIKQPQGLGELVVPLDLKPAEAFTGPIYVVDGENDLPVCTGNCLVPYNYAATTKDLIYPSASNGSGWYIVPGSGHGINFHYDAKNAYAHQTEFLQANGF